MGNLILVVEDEEAIRDLICLNLQAADYATEIACDGRQALEKAHLLHPDMILLDWMLPGMDGLDVLRHLRTSPEMSKIPVMMLTAKSEESDIVLGLEMGAVDYLTKPFSNKVLIARIRAILRRESAPPPEDRIRYIGLTLIPGLRRAILEDEEVLLTPNEFEILALLCSRPGHVYSRSQIVSRVKGEGYPVTDRSVDVQVASIRRKLGTFGARVETVRGIGYRMRGSE